MPGAPGVVIRLRRHRWDDELSSSSMDGAQAIGQHLPPGDRGAQPQPTLPGQEVGAARVDIGTSRWAARDSMAAASSGHPSMQ